MYANVADYRALYWPQPFGFLRPADAAPVWWPRAARPQGLRRGLGDLSPQSKQLVLSAPQIAGGILTAGGSASIAASWGALAVPVIGAAVVGATLAISALLNRKGPKQKIATTKIVEDVELPLRDLVAGYWAGPRTVSSQAQALAAFDAGWQYIVGNCGQEAMGEPGRRCISERDRGGVFDFFRAYRDPIAQDPDVKPDPQIAVNGAAGFPAVAGDAVSFLDSFFSSSPAAAGSSSGAGTGLLVGALLLGAAAVLL